MPNLIIKEKYWSHHAINACILKLKKLSSTDHHLHIYGEGTVQEIDILFFAYLLLILKQGLDTFPKFEITLHLPGNFKPYNQPSENTPDSQAINQKITAELARFYKEYKTDPNPDFGRKLRQYQAYLFLQNKMRDVITVEYGYYIDKPTDQINKLEKKETWFVLSGRFLPVFLIDNDNFNCLFKSGLGALMPFRKNDFKGLDNEAYYQRFRAALQSDIVNHAKSTQDGLRLLGLMAFYKSLRKSKIIRPYINPEISKEKYTVSNLGHDNSKEFYAAIKSVFHELEQQPLIHQFIFSKLISSEMVPNELIADNYEIVAKEINTLWSFTKELVVGIRELARNVVEHANSYGIITGRFYSTEQYKSLNPEVAEIFTTYFQGIKDDENINKAFFDFYVADWGKVGLLEKLKYDTDDLVENETNEKEYLKEDQDKIDEKEIGLKQLLDARVKLQLNQQAKRAMAHLGLLTLSKLVEKNHGMIRASTWETTSKKSKRIAALIHEHYSGDMLSALPNVGTNYHLVLPIDKREHYKPHYSTTIPNIPEVTPAYIEGIDRAFHYKLVQSDPLEPITFSENTRKILLDVKFPIPENEKLSDEYWEKFPLNGKTEFTDNAENIIVCLDLRNRYNNPSKLFRFLGKWELENPGLPIILYNISTADYFYLLRLNIAYTENQEMPFWNEKSIAIVYSVKNIDKLNRDFIFTDALWGENVQDFILINKQIRKTNFNALLIDRDAGAFPDLRDTFSDDEFKQKKELTRRQKSLLDSLGVFHTYQTLLPLDLLIQLNKEPLILQNAKYLLETEIKSSIKEDELPKQNIQRFISLIPGFKISDSHFRIGSKIHILNFYFAKRFFQNSFFASPIAYLVASLILDNQLNFIFGESEDDITKINNLKIKGITLIGYGQYSELLLSLVEQFLVKFLVNYLYRKDIHAQHPGTKRDEYISKLIVDFPINHDLINDQEDFLVIKREQKSENCILIIPIASTFSTSLKIEEVLNKILKNRTPIYPHINVLYIYNSDVNIPPKRSVERKFGIVEQDFERKLVRVEAFFDSESSLDLTKSTHIFNQQFILGLRSPWQDVEKCFRCFPQHPLKLTDEKPLFITDKTQVTPVLVFDSPKGRKIENTRTFVLPSEIVRFGHFEYNYAHYQYFIKTNEFFKRNKTEIFRWLNVDLRKEDFFRGISDEGVQVLIMAPGHFANTGFVNMVNEVLFSNAATIIHYDPRNDHIQNFQIFYRSEILQSKTKIIYVDDVITTGDTFLLANYFIKHTRQSPHGFDASIILLDRSSRFVNDNVERKLADRHNLYAFAELQLPPLSEHKNDCPICIEQNRFLELASQSYLDRLRYYFLEKSKELHCIDYRKEDIVQEDSQIADTIETNDPANKPSIEERFRMNGVLMRIEVTHRIYEWFEIYNFNSLNDYPSFYGWANDLMRKTTCPFSNTIFPKETLPPAESVIYECQFVTDAVFLTLSQASFTQFQHVKEKIFKWTISFLDGIVATIIKTKSISLSQFDSLQFLVGVAGQLNSNYLISDQFFSMLKIVFAENGLKALVNSAESERLKNQREAETRQGKTPDIFGPQEVDYHLLTYKNRLLKDKIKYFGVFISAQIKDLIYLNEPRSIKVEIATNGQLNSANKPHPLYVQLLRIIISENGSLIRKFWELIRPRLLQISESVDDDHSLYDYQFHNIYSLLNDAQLQKHYRYTTLQTFLKNKLGSDPAFVRFLWLMHYLENDHADTTQSLHDKTDLIITRLKEIMFNAGGDVGAFAMVKYIKKRKAQYFFPYNQGASGRVIENFAHEEGKYGYLRQFLTGILDNTEMSLKTVIEVEKRDKVWYDTYSTEKPEPAIDIHPNLISGDYDHLVILRLNSRELKQNPDKQSDLFQRDNGSAIIGFFSKELISLRNVRYLLLLRDSLHKFIERHHLNNEFRDWIDTLRERQLSVLTGHGREMLMDLAVNYPDPYNNIVYTILITQRFLMDENEENTFNTPKGHAAQMFRQFFKDKAKSFNLTQDYVKDKIVNLAKNIFERNEIENEDIADVEYIGEKFEFNYPDGLIDLICFELLLNAKKNRYINLVKPDYNNEIKIDAKIGEDPMNPGEKVLHFEIWNTGPYVPDDQFKELKKDGNPKGENQSSGIYLIRNLIDKFNLGRMDIRRVRIQSDEGWFIVELYLNKWPDV